MNDIVLPKVSIYLSALSRNNKGIWKSKLIYGKQEKIIGEQVSGYTFGSIYLRGILDTLKILKKPCNVRIYTDSGYLFLCNKNFMPSWRIAGWDSTNKLVLLMKELDEFEKIHKINWTFCKLMQNKILKELYSSILSEFSS